MLESGCNPNYRMPDGSNWTVLMLAAYSGHEELVQKFTKGGKGVSDKDPRSGFQAQRGELIRGVRRIPVVLTLVSPFFVLCWVHYWGWEMVRRHVPSLSAKFKEGLEYGGDGYRNFYQASKTVDVLPFALISVAPWSDL